MGARPVSPKRGKRAAWLMQRLENPVLARELRARMRGSRAYWILGVYSFVLSLIVLGAYYYLRTLFFHGSAPNAAAAMVGRSIWGIGCAAEALLLPLIVPAFTCGAITLEREKQLLEATFLTKVSPAALLVGKLASGLGLGVMLVLCSVPVLSLSFLLGGVAPAEVFASLCVLLSSVVLAGMIGLTASTLSARTSVAIACTYFTIGSLMFGVPAAAMLLGDSSSASRNQQDLGILTGLLGFMLLGLPIAGIVDAAVHRVRQLRHQTPPTHARWLMTFGLSWCAVLTFMYTPGVSDLFTHVEDVVRGHPVVLILSLFSEAGSTGVSVDDWKTGVLAYCLASLVLAWLAIIRVRRMRAG